MTADPIAVTVIGGYLGAGKTTLVNRILTGDHGRRIAVIVNDFGDVAIDEALLEPATGGVRSLANGCVCCAAVDGLAGAIAEIGALDPAPEHLLIEVSGVGDPWAVAQWGRVRGFALDAVVVVADPDEIRTWADDRYVGEGVRRQLAVADLVLLSRADATSERTRTEVQRWLGTLTTAPVIHGTDVPLSMLVGLSGPELRAADPLLGPAPHTSHAAHAAHASHAAHAAHTLRPDPTARGVVTAWLDAAPDGVVRVKGFVPAEDPDANPWLVHRVGRRCEVTCHHTPQPSGVVVISSAAVDPSALQNWCAELGEGRQDGSPK